MAPCNVRNVIGASGVSLLLALASALLFGSGTATAQSQVVNAVSAAAGSSIPVQVHIIGFGMSAADREKLERAAREGGASFEHVDDVQGLGNALGSASGLGAVATVAAEVEPNNHFGQANDIAMAGMFTGTLHPRGDVDWLRLRVNRQGELRVVSQAVPANIDLVVRLWNANRDVLVNWISATAKGGALDAVMDLPAAGEYVLELRDGRDDASSADAYQVELAFIPTADSGEANDSFGAATPIPLNTKLRANILPRGDGDWYVIDAPAQGQLEVSLTGVPSNLDLVYRVWNSNRDVLHNWQSPLAKGGENHGINDLPEAGRYTLEVRDGRDDARSPDPYTFQTDFKQSNDQSEPNNSFGQARSLAANGSLQATILPRGDSDWYRIEVDDQGQLDVALDPVPAELDVVFRIWNANRDVLHNWRSPLSVGGPNIQSLDLPAPGIYTIEVRDGRDDARSIDPYRLKLTFTATGDSGEPNNGFGAASRIALGGTVQGTILPRGDSDWYRVDAPAAGELEVQITSVHADLDIVFRVWNDNRDVAKNWVSPLSKGGNTVGAAMLKEPGRYFIEVRDGRDDNRSIQPYQLTTTLRATR